MNEIFMGFPSPDIKDWLIEHYAVDDGPVVDPAMTTIFYTKESGKPPLEKPLSGFITREYMFDNYLETGFSQEEVEDAWKVYIGNTVDNIGYATFFNCKQLEYVKLPSTLTKIEPDAPFYGCSALKIENVDTSFQKVGKQALVINGALYGLQNDLSETSIEVPSTVSCIGDSAFYEQQSLTSIILPDSVVEIGSFAFCNCSQLTHIELPSTLTSIWYNAFENTALESITLPGSITFIDDDIFFNCSNLTSLCVLFDFNDVDSELYPFTSVTCDVYAPHTTVKAVAKKRDWFGEDSSINVYCLDGVYNPSTYEDESFADCTVIDIPLLKTGEDVDPDFPFATLDDCSNGDADIPFLDCSVLCYKTGREETIADLLGMSIEEQLEYDDIAILPFVSEDNVYFRLFINDEDGFEISEEILNGVLGWTFNENAHYDTVQIENQDAVPEYNEDTDRLMIFNNRFAIVNSTAEMLLLDD